jgi:hypothetical protein
MIKVTEIVLLIVSISFCAALFLKIITGEQFLPIVLLVLGFYYKEKNDETVANAMAAVNAKSCNIDKLG